MNKCLIQMFTEMHHDAREHLERVVCDDWAQTELSDTSIIFIKSNQYFAAALRHNPFFVRSCPCFTCIEFSLYCAF